MCLSALNGIEDCSVRLVIISSFVIRNAPGNTELISVSSNPVLRVILVIEIRDSSAIQKESCRLVT